MTVANPDHPSTENLPESWEFSEEWYDFNVNPRENGAEILMTVDESSYSGNDYQPTMGEEHPVTWMSDYEGGRIWYTSIGHENWMFEDSLFLEHLLGGIRWAMALQNDSVPDTTENEDPVGLHQGKSEFSEIGSKSRDIFLVPLNGSLILELPEQVKVVRLYNLKGTLVKEVLNADGAHRLELTIPSSEVFWARFY
jgi:hypothetical protein